MKFFTDLSVDEIEKIKVKNINEQKIILANQTTSMLHGEKEAKKSEETAKKTFSENSMGSALPTVLIKKNQLNDKLTIIDLIILSKLEKSKSEIRRLIKGSGVRINNQIIDDEKLVISEKLFEDSTIKLSLGKKRHIKVEIN
jgi:tyrosyl-tRNA synthetase